MFKRLYRKFLLKAKPPKNHDVFYGDPLYFVISRPTEYVLHGLKDRNGRTLLEPIPSFGCLRLTIIMTTEDYYVCNTEVFCKAVNDLYIMSNNIGEWMERSQTRKMSKIMFDQMIVDGFLKKG